MKILDEYKLYKAVNKQFKGASLKNLLTNWKTTLASLVVLAVTFGPKFGLMNEQQSLAITGLAVAFGFAAAKDSNVTGGTKQQ